MEGGAWISDNDAMNERELFLAALEKDDSTERAAYLAQACGDDANLRQRIERLLRLHGEAGSFLDSPAFAPSETVEPQPGESPAEREPIHAESVLTVKRAAREEESEAVGTLLGRYKLLQLIGEGGMGVVYMAEQQQPVRRLVAVKVLKAGMDSALGIARFEAECQALALMDHPNIAKVLDGGTTAGGRPYFVMELVKGIPITTYCDEHRLSLRQRLELFVPLCQGLQHAHQKGIIHRDIKPSNVLAAPFDGKPVVKVIDFGVAKALGQRLTKRTMFTHLGTVIGTLEYMSPEQAELNNHDVDTRTDVFSLGVVLYELLTGTTPLTKERLKDTTLLETLRRIREEEPPRPSTRLSGSKDSLPAISAQRRTDPEKLLKVVRGELDWIVMKALDKDRNRRYATANSLADDIARYLRDEPVEACPPSVSYHVRKFTWRYRIPLVIASLIGTLLVLAAVASLSLAMRAQTAERVAVTARNAADQRADDLDWENYINRVNRAYREAQDDNITLAEELLHRCPIERRSWEWHYVQRLCQSERLSVDTLAGSVCAVAFSPNGSQIATGVGGTFSVGRGGPNVDLWERATGQRRLSLRGTQHHIWSLAFSPDGTKLAVGGRDQPIGSPQVGLWDARTGASHWTRHEPDLPQAMSVAFSPDGKLLAVGFGERGGQRVHPVKLYEVATGRETLSFPGPKGGNKLAFHRDGRHLAVAGSEVVEVWDVVAHARVHELRGHSLWIYCVSFSPDGKWLATGGFDRTIKLWDTVSGEARTTIYGHNGGITDLAFSPDSRSLASASEDRSVRLWEIPTGRLIGVFHGHKDSVQSIAFAPDGLELASAGVDASFKIWDRRRSLPVVFKHTRASMGLWYRRDGRRIISSAFFDQGPVISEGWDPSTGEPDPNLTLDRVRLGNDYLPYPILPGFPVASPATSPDGRLFASVSRSNPNVYEQDQRSKSLAVNAVMVRDVATGRILHTLVGHAADVNCIAFSPNGQRIATTSSDRTVKLWDTATGREVFTLRGHTNDVIALVFSPDGNQIVSADVDHTDRVWDATPLPASNLRVQEARDQKKETETKTIVDRIEAEESARGRNSLSAESQWDLAAAGYAKFVKGDPTNLQLRYAYILLLVKAGNGAGVRRACEDLLRQFDSVTDPGQANRVAWDCVLASDAVSDLQAPVRLASAALDGLPEGAPERSAVLNTLGAALYRAGHFEEAVRRLNESIQARGGKGLLQGLAFLAMAHHRQGHHDEAKHWLEKLVALQPKQGFDVSQEDVETRILSHEAQSLILRGAP
jgi:WD40 repeat protein/serine/threonine protein kinase